MRHPGDRADVAEWGHASGVAVFRLADRCPRLARARDEFVLQEILERAGRRRRLRELMAAERLVAHRELQLARAMHVGDARYIARRERKLANARKIVARLSR